MLLSCSQNIQVENHFFKMKGIWGWLEAPKRKKQGSLHSKDAQSHMTPSLYLCFIVHRQSLIWDKDMVGMVFVHVCTLVNPRRACAARVTVIGSVCTVCLLLHISLLECLFVCTNDTTYLINGQWRSEIMSGFLWKCSVAKLFRRRLPSCSLCKSTAKSKLAN